MNADGPESMRGGGFESFAAAKAWFATIDGPRFVPNRSGYELAIERAEKPRACPSFARAASWDNSRSAANPSRPARKPSAPNPTPYENASHDAKQQQQSGNCPRRRSQAHPPVVECLNYRLQEFVSGGVHGGFNGRLFLTVDRRGKSLSEPPIQECVVSLSVL